ncbi:MAG TPA: mannose-1-phosphate guanylyltransferase/mannose-6-phosphate isomerase [Burkholderiales bacterium]
MSQSIYPVVLCGGAGTRLWPMSRKALPKQFLSLVSERSMLQETVLRVQGMPNSAGPVVVSNNEHRFLVAEQLREIDVTATAQILEPVGRNTAPAIAVAALHINAINPDGVLLVLPADHLIKNEAAFRDAVQRVIPLAAKGWLMTFGIKPDRPATEYGYIECGDVIEGDGVFKVARFVEKPDEERAQAFIESGRFNWNSGMFAFSAAKFIEELGRHRPDILEGARAAWSNSTRDLDFVRLDEKHFAACPADSVDYAVMEKTDRAATIPVDIGWSDVGSWSTLWDVADKDAQGNVLRGDVHAVATKNCYVRAEKRMVSVLGIEDAVVVETGDAVLVAHRSCVQQVKDIVGHLDRMHRQEHLTHKRVYRPWGYYECIDGGNRFQVKRLMVKPQHALSLQMHHHRAEHWVVVSGTARVTCGENVALVSENQSTYIPIGTKHRLENPGKVPLFLVEVQSGGYLGEDDIVRFEDQYHRA